MEVLVVKIHKSLQGGLQDPKRKTIKECTRKYWKCSKERRNLVKAIIGIKDGTIYSAFEVNGYEDSEEQLGRTEFICGDSIDSLIGYKLESSKKPTTILYYDMEKIKEEIVFDKNLDEKRKKYLKKNHIPYD